LKEGEIMIDIHSHILPGIDDGADTIETTIEMLKVVQADGIKTIFATPHYYRGHFDNDYKQVKKYVNEIRNWISLSNSDIQIEILPGQEVFISNYTLMLYKEGIIGTLNNTRYMLVELPFDNLDNTTLDVLYELRLLGVIPIIAHPERYSYIIEKPSSINQLISEGCLFQINSGNILGGINKQAKRTADILIKHGICDFIASDVHRIGNRYSRVYSAYEKVKKDNSKLGKSLMDNMQKLIENTYIEHSSEKIKEKRNLFSITAKRL
jgi:protein-tyrosine phosphatase